MINPILFSVCVSVKTRDDAAKGWIFEFLETIKGNPSEINECVMVLALKIAVHCFYTLRLSHSDRDKVANFFEIVHCSGLVENPLIGETFFNCFVFLAQEGASIGLNQFGNSMYISL